MAVMTGTVPYIQNQLQFNLDVPPTLSHMAVRYKKPEAIVVERLGGSSEKKMPNFVQHAAPPFNFSAVSEDKLSVAVQLARRDLKKKKIEEEMKLLEEEEKRKKSKTPKGKGADKKKKSKPKDVVRRLREVEKNKNPRSKEVQTDSRQKKPKQKKPIYLPSGGVVLRSGDLEILDRSDSPPTRDTDDYQPAISQDERNAREIKRLRKELGNYIKQINQMEDSAKTGDVVLEPVRTDREAKEEAAKRKIRVEERASRSARMLYVLQQQVREIQEELAKLEPGKSPGAKKTQTINRLAAAHRGALRALQTFINHLPESDIRQGLPRIYHELSLLIRQLSECCSQLEIGGETGVPDIVNLVQKEYYDDWQRQPKTTVTEDYHDGDKKRKILKKGKGNKEHVRYSTPHQSGRDQEYARQPRDRALDNLCKELQTRNTKVTPNRETALRAGIEALLHAADSPTKPVTPKKKEPVSQRKVPPLPLQPPTHKGVLIPSKIQRERSQPVQAFTNDPHYAEPTFASQLKVVEPEAKETRAESPRRSPSPVCPRSPQATRKGLTPRSPGRKSFTPRRDVLGKLNFGLPNEWVRDAERAIKSKIKPLLDRADEISAAVADLEKAKLSLRQKLSEKTAEKVEMNADVLSDMILNDLLHDTAVSLSKLESEREAEVDAMTIQDGSSLEVMWQRMKDMENEQNDIRRRWNSVTYGDTGRENLRPQMDVENYETPRTPPPIHLMRGDDEEEVGYLPETVQPRLQSTGPIVFTKDRKQKHVVGENLRFSAPLSSRDAPSNQRQPLVTPAIPLYIHEDDLDRIIDNRRRFESYLRRTAQDAVGTFNPAGLVERIADSIMNDCFEDVASEMMETNSEVVRYEFKTELAPTLIRTDRDVSLREDGGSTFRSDRDDGESTFRSQRDGGSTLRTPRPDGASTFRSEGASTYRSQRDEDGDSTFRSDRDEDRSTFRSKKEEGPSMFRSQREENVLMFGAKSAETVGTDGEEIGEVSEDYETEEEDDF